MNVRFIKVSLLTGALCLSANLAFAQQDVVPTLPSCDQALATAQNDLQKQADATCSTTKTCIACKEKKSGAVIYATLIAQPKCPAPATGKATTAFKKPISAKKTSAASADRPAAPAFEVLQARCEDGSGVDLDVFIPGNAVQCAKDQYTYLWEIDGGKGGHAADLKCACGKVAKLTVTDSKTGLSFSKRIELLPCGKK